MSNGRFDRLITVSEWADALKQLLGEAEVAVRERNAQSRAAVRDRLNEFIKKSPTAAEPLDAIAREASTDLLTAQVDTAIQAITARNADLARATNLIEGVTAEAQKGAAALQFEKVVDLLGRAEAGIEALKGLEAELGATDDDLEGKMEAVTDAIKKLKDAASDQ